MAILSTNQRLINVGDSYSAGSGIDITNHIISVVESAVGTNYSAGPNIDIYDDEGQPTISSKDWTNDIEQASAYAYEQAIAQIPEPQDLSYLSGRIDTNTNGIDYISSVCLTAHQDWTDTIKGASSYSYEQSTSYFDNWISGQYTGDITNITNKVTAISGNFDNYYKKTETSSKDEINDALQYVSANAGKVYEGVSPIVVNNTEDKISADTWTFSAGDNVSFVDDNVNKITRIDVELPQPQDLSYISAQVDSANQGVDYLSGVVITALPSDMATTGDVAELAQTISETYYQNTNPSSFVNEDWVTAQGYITGVDLSEYAKRDFVLSSVESVASGKLDVSSFASVSSDFLTNEDLNGYATESFVENVSGDITALIPTNYYPDNNPSGFISGVDLTPYQTTADANTLSSMLSGAIDDISANVSSKQDSLTFGYDEQDRINSINNSALAGGGTSVVSGIDDGLVYFSAEGAGAIYGKPFNGTYSGFFSAINEATITNNTVSITCPEPTVITRIAANSYDYYNYKTSPNGEWIGPVHQFDVECEFVSNNGVVVIPISSNNSRGVLSYFSAFENVEVTNKLVIPPFIDVEGFVKKSDSKLEIGNGASATSESFALGHNSAYNQSFAQGYNNSSYNQSLAQGSYNTAYNYSLAQGYYNSANSYSLAQGEYNKVNGDSLAQGLNNSANSYSLVQGGSNSAFNYSLAQGGYNSAFNDSLAQGHYNSAYNYSFAQGYNNKANNYSIAQGYYTSASNCSQAFGYYTSASNSGMAIGVFNKNTSAAFVVGNGTWGNRSDAFIIYRDGRVSAVGKISANGVELGGGDLSNYATTSQLNTASSFLSGAIDYVSANAGGTDYYETAVTSTQDFVVEQPGQVQSGNGNLQYSKIIETIYKTNDIVATALGLENLNNAKLYANFSNVTSYNISSPAIYLSGTLNGNNTYGGWLFNNTAAFTAALMNGINLTDISSRGDVSRAGNDIPDNVLGVYFITNANNSTITAKTVPFTASTTTPGTTISMTALYDSIPDTSDFVPLSSFNELKASYDTLSSLFATYSGQWLLPNEGV